jgi:hypothetical protein
VDKTERGSGQGRRYVDVNDKYGKRRMEVGRIEDGRWKMERWKMARGKREDIGKVIQLTKIEPFMPGF